MKTTINKLFEELERRFPEIGRGDKTTEYYTFKKKYLDMESKKKRT